MLNTQSPSHIVSADYLRALASLMVAVFHLGGKTQPVLNYGWLGVQLFFVLSGFIICWSIPNDYSLKDLKSFFYKRLIRIEPPFLISIALVIIINIILIKNYQPDWLNIVMHFAYLNNFFEKPYLSPVYWTLGIEFQFYIFIGFLFPFIIKSYGKWLLLILAVIFSIIPNSGQTLINNFSLFAMGMFCFLLKKGFVTVIEFLAFQILLVILIANHSGTEQMIAASIACIILLTNFQGNLLIDFLAKISFSLYLTHDIIGSNLVVYLGTQFPKTLEFKALIFITGLLMSIIFAYLFYQIIERPFLKKSKTITLKTSVSSTSI